jgi:hypothetical protein
MPVNQVLATEALARGLRTEFVDTYRRFGVESEAKLEGFMTLGIPSDKSVELYAYFESAPHAQRWPFGEEIPRGNFRARSWEVENIDWGLAIDFHKNHVADDQTRSLRDQARDGGANFALLAERVAFQIMLGTTDTSLLAAVPNAPDGAALFSATDGAGDDRFGVSGGNIESQTGVADAQDILTDLFDVISRFRAMEDTEGQPLLLESFLEEMLIVYGTGDEKVFREAFTQKMQESASGNAGVSSVVLDSGLTHRLWSTPRITDNSFKVFLPRVPTKPLFRQVRQEIEDNVEDMSNSDLSRRTKNQAVQWDARFGFGVALPYAAIDVT